MKKLGTFLLKVLGLIVILSAILGAWYLQVFPTTPKPIYIALAAFFTYAYYQAVKEQP